MSHDAGAGIFSPQCFQQGPEGGFLEFRTGVSSTAFLIQSSLIDDAKGAVVVTACMSTSDSLWKQWNDITVATHIIMVGALPVLCLAAGDEGFSTERFVAPVSNTVYHQQPHRRM